MRERRLIVRSKVRFPTLLRLDNELLSIAMNTSLSLLETVERSLDCKAVGSRHVYEAEGTYEKAAKALGVDSPDVSGTL